MITYVGIDPGVHECGVAIEWVRKFQTPGLERRTYSAFLVRGELHEMLADIAAPLVHSPAITFCVEGQQFYGTERSKGDPQDLIRLAQVAGAVVGALLALHGVVDYSIPLPRQWKGSTPKAIHHARLARDYPHWVEPVAANTPKSKQHHVWDAVGLLEWHKGRSKT